MARTRDPFRGRFAVEVKGLAAAMLIPSAVNVLDENLVGDAESPEREDCGSHRDPWLSLATVYSALGAPHQRGLDATLRAEQLEFGVELVSKLYPSTPREVGLPPVTEHVDEFRKPDALSIS